MRKTLIVAAVVGLVGFAAYRWQASDSAPASAQERDGNRLVKDRVWVDHPPKHDRDTINLFLALTKRPRQGPQGPFGVFEAVSVWQGRFEAFRYETEGEQMRIIFPQTNERETLTVKASKCDDVPEMDFCLDVSGSSRGVKRYYSRRGWEVRTLDEAQALVNGLTP